MRVAKIERVRQRMLREAIADNLDTIRGLPPRTLRPSYRLAQLWIRRLSFIALPLTLIGSSYLVPPDLQPKRTATATSAESAPPAPHRFVAASAASPTAPSLIDGPIQRVAAAALPLSVRRVVLDAGHGGSDPGTISALSLAEKDITLDVGDRLKTLLEQNGFEVVITRSEDRTIPLRERARIANASRSDIFVSIHVNALLKHTASHGVETYYLGPTSDPVLTKLAAAENRASGYSLADLRKLLDGIYADVRRDESLRLANAVQSHLYSGLHQVEPGLENWGVKKAPFIVLVATEMPAILAEVGCLSNPREATMLGQANYRQKIAEALFQGIQAYASANGAPERKERS